MCSKLVWISNVLSVFVEAKLRTSAKQMFSHIVLGCVSQTNTEEMRSICEVELARRERGGIVVNVYRALIA